MTTHKHTAGPWKEHDGFICGRFSDGQCHDICDPRCAPAESGLMEEMDANTKLICAAPALLAALEKIAERTEYAEGSMPRYSRKEASEIAREAIALATGSGVGK